MNYSMVGAGVLFDIAGSGSGVRSGTAGRLFSAVGVGLAWHLYEYIGCCC